NTFIFGSPADESTVGIYRVGHTDLIAADTANDTADYSAHTQALTISLDQTAGVAEGPSAGTDSLFGIEHAIGGSAADTMFGDALDNLLAGSQGNDTIRGADGADTIDGGADNDLIYGGPGADDIDGGGGIDTLDFSTDNADGGIAGAYVDLANDFAQDGFGDYDMIAGIERVIGTVEDRVIGALSDVLLGDENANSFSGLAGLDYIVGDGGNDTIDTGAGMAGTVGDIAVAGAGDDSVLGGSGATFVYGQDGSDDIFGGAGDDWLFGGDFFGVVSGVDLLVGEGGNDVLAVGSATGSAYMYGGAGDDIIYGGSTTPEADVLVGGTGDDFMYGGFGGADDYWFVTGDLAAGDFDQIYGFDSNDELIFSSSYSGQITAQQLTLNDVSGSYLSHASGWALWMPYTNVNTVLSQTVFSNGSPPV
ncbi:MAG: calcium-binding protein, partial [Hyphomicrobiaceae bacterium]